jgi:PAS domain S-box-containing protein
VYEKLKNLFGLDSYWKERIIGLLGAGMYFVGNLVEIATSPTHTTTDPPLIWITGGILSIALIFATITRFKRFTSILFIVFIYFVNFNIVFGYAESTTETYDKQSFYLFFCYAIFIVTSQMLDSRKELYAITGFEAVMFALVVYFTRSNHPLLLQATQQLMLGFVFIGNMVVAFQRMRLTQISGGSTIQFKAISESARDVQSIINSDFNFLYINPSIAEIAGYSMNDLNGKSILTLVSEADRDAVSDALKSIDAIHNDKKSVEYRIKTATGKEVWVESIFSRFKASKHGKVDLIFAETRNIEVRKQLEAEIQQQLEVEQMLIKHSNQFINVGRTEIQSGIDLALSDFGTMLGADAVLVFRMHGKLQDEFRCTNQWITEESLSYNQYFNLSIKINQHLVAFLRTLRGDKASHGNFYDTQKLHEIQALKTTTVAGKKFYLIPLQSGSIVNGFIMFMFDEKVAYVQSSFFGLIGNVVASAFTRLRTELRLHEAQLTNESILRALPDWLYIINRNGEFTGTNNYTTLPDYIPDYGLIGKTFRDVLPEDISGKFAAALTEVIEKDSAASFEYLDTKVYKDKSFKTIIAPFKANEYLVIIRDVTDLKSAQFELQSKAKKLEQSNKELEEFAYVVSHDMKQPIRTIISYLTLLQKKHGAALKPEAQEFINFSVDGANKMSDLIRDILQYSRLEQQINLVNNVSMNQIVNKVCAGLKDTIEKSNAEVICDNLPVLTCNDTMLTELFQNLIENGIKYNINQKKTVRVTVTDQTDQWLFRISDNGIGFEQQYAAQIFKIFKRLHTDQEFQGTGIGLSICAKVIEKHGGRIWAESEKGKGSNFFFTLPKQAGAAKHNTAIPVPQ